MAFSIASDFKERAGATILTATDVCRQYPNPFSQAESSIRIFGPGSERGEPCSQRPGKALQSLTDRLSIGTDPGFDHMVKMTINTARPAGLIR